MAKNVKVTDSNGLVIGYTYPKRAKGLVRNGRAESVSDCEIRLQSASASSVFWFDCDNYNSEQKTEEENMSKVLSFDAKDFADSEELYHKWGASGKFLACRKFTDPYFSESAGEIEIGSLNPGWSEISAIKEISPNTDYVFRFAVIGGIRGRGNCTTRLVLLLEAGDEKVYSLEENLYKPVVCKRDSNKNFIRIFEVPFQSGDSKSVRIFFTASCIHIRLLPAEALKGLDQIADLSYENWLAGEEAKHRRAQMQMNFVAENAHKSGRRSIDLSGAAITVEVLEKILSMGFDDIDLSDSTIS